MYFLAQFAEQFTLHMDVPKLENRTYKGFLVFLVYIASKSGFLVLILVPQSNGNELCLTLITSFCLLYYY